jgi:tetratricopeptide (TPR) repeat protein
MKRWLYIFLLVSLVGCQSAEAILAKTTIASTAMQVLTSTPTASPSPTSTLMPIPTLTPTSKPCPQTDVNLTFIPPEDFKDVTSIESFLNAGGDSKQLAQYYEVTVEELNTDTVPEILVQAGSPFENIKHLLLFSCTNGEYKEQLIREDNTDLGLTKRIEIMAVDDLNKNGVPELVYKTTCLAVSCELLFIVEWDGEKFSNLVKDNFLPWAVDYADMREPQDVYFKDLDNDGIPELIWTGEMSPKSSQDYWDNYPRRLATHVYKWDGKKYAALRVTYGTPEFRYQAIQDGDRYSFTGEYQKALDLYELAINSDNLDWWTADRRLYNLIYHGFYGGSISRPTPDPNERSILSAYASYRIMIVHILINDLKEAEIVYQKLLQDYPSDNPAYPIAEMAILFWNEYQTSKSISKACIVSIHYIDNYPDVLYILSGGSDNSQDIRYYKDSNEVCPFR